MCDCLCNASMTIDDLTGFGYMLHIIEHTAHEPLGLLQARWQVCEGWHTST